MRQSVAQAGSQELEYFEKLRELGVLEDLE
jgi:hypothetical protein